MEYKEWCENQEVEYHATVSLNGEIVGQISSFSQEGLIEDMRKLTHALDQSAKQQYEDLPENQNDND